jgi:hypothetical protein
MNQPRRYTGTVVTTHDRRGEIRSDGGLLSPFAWGPSLPPPAVGQRVTYRADQPYGIAYDIEVDHGVATAQSVELA